jgi:hypothetical protein
MNFSVDKIKKSTTVSGGWSTVSNNSVDDIKIFYNSGDTSTENSKNFNVVLQDASSAWRFNVTDGTESIDLQMSYEDSMLSASADNGTSAKFSPDGFVEITAEDSDYTLDMVFNEGYYTLPWYDVEVDGHNSNVASMKRTAKGIELSGDNLEDVTVIASNDDITTDVNFSTTENLVLIYSIDKYTIGVAIDEDGDGKYETTIAKTTIEGDLNGDRAVDSMDIMLMKKAILGISDISADLNGDGKTNALDLVILKAKLMNE